MSLQSVVGKDVTSVRRSRALWGVATVLALLAALVVYSKVGFGVAPQREAQDAYGLLVGVIGVLLPAVALVASYMSIAGERESGGIKFLLAFPNTRRDVFVGKLLSRLAVVTVGLGFMFLAATSIIAAKYGTVPLGVAIGVFAVSLLYCWVFVGLAVAFSASVASRSQAVAAAVGSYFILVILNTIFGFSRVVSLVHDTVLGMEPNPHLYDAVDYLSPYTAYQKAIHLVLPEEIQRPVFRRSLEASSDLPTYLTDEFALVVFAAWLAIPLFLGYVRFERSDLQ
ncbi:ABC transporter permease subunit [Halorientalis halophila]|uniref:ABC transporter permease subunit n=1 Tax=Halorientalis halophila TaxID=3108499 RepID=UPI00300AD20C